MNADGSGKRLLTRSTSHLYAWSPDGRKIAFGRLARRQRRYPRDERRRERAAEPHAHAERAQPRCCLVARRAEDRVHEDQPADPAPEIYVMNADGSGKRRLTRSTTAGDLSYLVARRAEDRLLSGGGPHPRHERRRERKAAPDAQRRACDTTRCRGGVWSPDGRKIAFTGGDRNGLDVYVMNADGSGRRNLTRRPVDYGS